MKKYLILFLIFTLVRSTSLAYANTYVPANDEGSVSVMVGKFSDVGTATISGKFTTEEEGKYVSVLIYAPEMDESNITLPGSNKNSVLPFAGSTTSDENGEFAIEITLTGASGEYSAYFGPAESGETLIRIPIYYSNKTENVTALGILNDKAAAVTGDATSGYDAAGITDVENFVDSNSDALAFRFSLYEGISAVDHTEVIKTLVTYLKSEPFDTNDRDGASGVFKTLVFARALTEDKVADLETYAASLPIFTAEDGILKQWYADASTEEKAELLTRLTGLTSKTLEAFEKKAVEMAVLTRIHHADGDGEVRQMLTNFESYTEIATSGLRQAVYDGLERGNFATYTELKEAIEELKKIPEPDYTPPLGGGLGGAAIQGEYYTPPVQNEPIEENDGFKDVSEDDWYYDAVYELVDRGIVSGKSADTFAPNDSITREEIVKMLVVMENLTLDNSDNLFKDVTTNDWFFKYVNVAAKYGIVNGIGEGVFGTGQNVTRQDIAVMLYNIAVKNGISTELNEETETQFSDADMISDYATDAVLMLSQLKVINGYDDLSFRPQNFVTRAEAAKLIREFIYINN